MNDPIDGRAALVVTSFVARIRIYGRHLVPSESGGLD
jgi:hypothetical protein